MYPAPPGPLYCQLVSPVILYWSQVAGAFGPHDDVAGVVVTVGCRAAECIQAWSICKFVDDRVVIEHVAIHFAERTGATGHAKGPLRSFFFQDPAHAIDVVHERLGNIVAREPLEVIPVGVLVLRFAQPFAAWFEPIGTAQEHRLHGHDVADRSVVNPLDRLLPTWD